jgi:radical SAM superfamily enzyme YgiQ (UPF0313 family)
MPPGPRPGLLPAPGSLRAPGCILLISCYELGHQPLGTAWPAAFLERAGFTPDQLDLTVEELDPERVRRARLVALSVPMHTALRLGLDAARRVRAVNPECVVVCFGLYAQLNREFLRTQGIDAVLAGESEAALVALAERLDAGTWQPGTAPSPAPVPPGPVMERLMFPVPSRARLPTLGRYAALEREGRRVPAAAVETSRGCLSRCRHCPIPPVYGGRFFVVPIEVVLADARQVVTAGARHVTFADADFLNGPGHALRVARALNRAFPDVTFDFTAKIEHLLRHRALLPELAALGCVFIVSAVESLSDRVLSILDKGHDRGDVETAVALVAAAGLVLRPTFVPFTPWTTLDDYREMLEFVAAHDLLDAVDPVQYGLRLLVPPGSLLLDRPELAPHLRGLDPTALGWRWQHPDPRMEELQRDVSAATRAGAAAGTDPLETFDRVWELARAAAQAPRGRPATRWTVPRPRHPRLTEPWFC